MTFEEKALAAGGHLADDVAFVVVDELHEHSTEEIAALWEKSNRSCDGLRLLSTALISEDTALD